LANYWRCSKARIFDLQEVAFASNLRDHQENTSNLINSRGSKKKQIDHAYVVAPNKIDKERKVNLMKKHL
jgi:hypothetical protein